MNLVIIAAIDPKQPPMSLVQKGAEALAPIPANVGRAPIAALTPARSESRIDPQASVRHEFGAWDGCRYPYCAGEGPDLAMPCANVVLRRLAGCWPAL